MTIALAIIALTIAVALYLKFVLDQPWPRKGKLAADSVLALPPGFAWWMAFNSPGGGWGFALIAFSLSAAIALGSAMGALLRANR